VILRITCTWVADLKRNDAYAIDMLAPDTLTRRRERIAGIHGAQYRHYRAVRAQHD
jgi:hypothetical protein